MKVKLAVRYQRWHPDYTPEETAKLDAARIQVFGADREHGCQGFVGAGGGPEGEEHNRVLQEKLHSVYRIAGVPEKTCEPVVHVIELELPDFPSDGHHISSFEARGVGGKYDGLLLDRVNQ